PNFDPCAGKSSVSYERLCGQFSDPDRLCRPRFRRWNTGSLTRHEFFVKKFERALLQAVESNRLRRFGRLREFSRSCFSLACAARIIFFFQNLPARSLPPCSIDAVEFCTYGAASAPPWILTITIRSLQHSK